MIEETISHYRILEKIGSGGMGDVYKAEDTKLKRTVALKFLPREVTRDDEAKQRFIVEAQAASSLDHPNIGTIYEIDDAEDRSFIAMAYYGGGTLRDRLSEGELSVEEAVDIALQMARGLAKAHDRNIVHRDIKPANIMLAEDGHVKIVDFGLAKLAGQSLLTRTGTTLGTVAYMSPEQASGKSVDQRTDIWSVGVILHEMLAGDRPFKGEYEQAVIYSVLNAQPEFISKLRPGMPAELEKVIEKALEKDPDRRYQKADELVRELEAIQNRIGSGEDDGTTRIRRLGRRQKRTLAAMASAVALLVVLVGLYALRSGSTDSNLVTIAVLPMALETASEEVAWLSSGVTDALITDLAQIENIRVISQRSVIRYANTDQTLHEIAEALKVTYVVDGSVWKAGDEVRISARLADATTDEYVWADRYETDFTAIPNTQSMIAGAIARQIHGELSPRDRARLGKQQPVDPETYEAYLKGMHHLGKHTPEDFQKGLAYLHGAVDKNPGDARAWAGLALGYITVGHSPHPTPDARQRARAAAQRAVRLDSTLAEAVAAAAIVEDYYEWDWEEAERLFKRSIELNPSLAMSHYHYSWMLLMLDRMDEAIREHELAVEFDPLFPPQTAWMGAIYRMAGRYEDALAQADKALDLGDRSGIAYLVRGNVFLDQGQLDRAIAEHEKMVETNPVWKGFLGATYAAAGRKEDALRIVEEIEARGENSMDAYQLAFLFGRLGDADKAFRWLNYKPAHVFVPWLATKWAPLYSLRDDPRYQEFLDELGLSRPQTGGSKVAV